MKERTGRYLTITEIKKHIAELEKMPYSPIRQVAIDSKKRMIDRLIKKEI